MLQLILASQSPRRRELLEKAGYEFIVDTVKVSETIDENLNLAEALKVLAHRKAVALVNTGKILKGKGFLILAADTVVELDGEVLGKPKDFSQAVEFLTRLSARTHSVHTAICLWDVDADKQILVLETTQVTFKSLARKQITDYIRTGEPMDKAGAYAIQGLGGDFVLSYQGSWSNVVGLPMEVLEQVITQQGWNVRRRSPKKGHT